MLTRRPKTTGLLVDQTKPTHFFTLSPFLHTYIKITHFGTLHRDSRVRREICRWAVPDVRRNVIQRTRHDLTSYREAAQKFQPKNILTTVSYEKRADWAKDEEHIVRKMERKVGTGWKWVANKRLPSFRVLLSLSVIFPSCVVP